MIWQKMKIIEIYLMSMNDKCNTLADKEIGLENHVIHLPGPDWFWTA